jgi:hypothetical protein
VPTESDSLDAVQHPAACRDRLSVHRHGPITVSILNDFPSPAPIRVASHADTTAGWRPSVALLRIEVGGHLPPFEHGCDQPVHRQGHLIMRLT